jgi:hypothetical protein
MSNIIGTCLASIEMEYNALSGWNRIKELVVHGNILIQMSRRPKNQVTYDANGNYTKLEAIFGKLSP